MLAFLHRVCIKQHEGTFCTSVPQSLILKGPIFSRRLPLKSSDDWVSYGTARDHEVNLRPGDKLASFGSTESAWFHQAESFLSPTCWCLLRWTPSVVYRSKRNVTLQVGFSAWVPVGKFPKFRDWKMQKFLDRFFQKLASLFAIWNYV